MSAPASDAAMRSAERRWRASGSIEDEVSYLSARLRAGLVPEDRVELAARFGVESAQGALGRAVPPATGWRGDARDPLLISLRALCGALSARRELARVPIARALEGPASPAAVARLEEELDAIEAWALCPCAEHRRAADRERRAGRPGDLATHHVDREVGLIVAFTSRGEERGPSQWTSRVDPDDPDVRARLRAWCLGEPLPAVDGEAVRAKLTEQARLAFAASFALASEVWLLAGTPDRPSFHDEGGRRVVPVLVCAGPHRAQFARTFGVEETDRTRRVPAAELLHDLLPRWAEDGLFVVPVVEDARAVIEVEPLDLQRELASRLSRAVAEEHRQHMEWVRKKRKRPAR